MKKGIIGLLVLIVLGLSILVLALEFNSPIKFDVRPCNGKNVTGSINLNVTIMTQMTNNNNSIANVTFAWFNMSGHRLHNTTIFNTSLAQTSFQNTSFDTRLLPDGSYNITITAYNNSGIAFTNATLARNITVDNTPPNVTVNLGTANNLGGQFGSNFSVLSAIKFSMLLFLILGQVRLPFKQMVNLKLVLFISGLTTVLDKILILLQQIYLVCGT